MNLQEALHNTVASANQLNDLLPMLNFIPLSKIKNFIDQEINALDQTSSRKMHFTSLSINDIFSDDITQYILSFVGIYQPKSVNKQWQNFCNKNESIYLRQLCDSVAQILTKSPLQYFKNVNKTWVVHPNRQKLHKLEIDAGFCGPVHNIDDAVAISNSGDALLLHDGLYTPDDGFWIKKNIHIIGVGSQVIIADVTHGDSFCVIGPWISRNSANMSDAYFENLNFNCTNSNCTEGIFHLSTDCKLWLKHCKFTMSCYTGIQCRDGSVLNVDNCEFIGGTNAIEISPLSKEVNVINSVFKNCGLGSEFHYEGEGGCISVSNDSYLDLDADTTYHPDEFVQLKCIGNIFEDNMCMAIVERHEPDEDEDEEHVEFIINTDRCILRNNVLKGGNGTSVNKLRKGVEINDANKMYYNDLPCKGDQW